MATISQITKLPGVVAALTPGVTQGIEKTRELIDTIRGNRDKRPPIQEQIDRLREAAEEQAKVNTDIHRQIDALRQAIEEQDKSLRMFHIIMVVIAIVAVAALVVAFATRWTH